MEVSVVPTKNPRLNVVLEPALYQTLQKLAEHDGVSLSLKARDLIREALEIHEDLYWDAVASERENAFNKKQALSHEEIWK